MTIESINAITLVVGDMARSVPFYETLGFEVIFGGPAAAFTSLAGGNGFVNLTRDEGGPSPSSPFPFWGRVIFHVDDVDAVYARARSAGFETLTAPADAQWGERYFHIRDPDGHELSIARPL